MARERLRRHRIDEKIRRDVRDAFPNLRDAYKRLELWELSTEAFWRVMRGDHSTLEEISQIEGAWRVYTYQPFAHEEVVAAVEAARAVLEKAKGKPVSFESAWRGIGVALREPPPRKDAK